MSREPAPSNRLERTGEGLWRDLWPLLRGQRGLYALAILLAPVTTTMVVLQPWLLQRAIDGPIRAGDAQGAIHAAWLYLAAILVGFAAQAGHTLALSTAAMRSIAHVRKAVFTHTMSRSAAFFDHQPTGRLLTRATSDVESLGETLTAGAITILLDALQVVGVLVAMFWLNTTLTLVLLMIGPVLVGVVELLRRKLRVLYLKVQTRLSELNAFISERLEGIETVQLYRDEPRTLEGFDQRLHRYRDATIRTNVFDALMYACVDGVGTITLAMMLWYGAGDWLGEGVTIGILAAFIDYVGRLFRPIQEFSQKLSTVQRATAALRKILGLLDVKAEIKGGDHELSEVKGHLRLQDVGFRYTVDGPQILEGIDLELKPGQTVALVGRTGSGKTSLGRLLQRVYDGFTGAITLDGVPIAELPLAQLRESIVAVSQDVQVLPGDVRFNLTFGRDISDARIHQVLKLVHADDVVERLGGLDAAIEVNARNLSAGEAQLLSFARTMLADPPIVILDEATASVDSITEARLQAATQAVLSQKTTLVIAHRLSTIVHADQILVLSHGKILERGTHTSLMAAHGAYAALFEEQHAELPDLGAGIAPEVG